MDVWSRLFKLYLGIIGKVIWVVKLYDFQMIGSVDDADKCIESTFWLGSRE